MQRDLTALVKGPFDLIVIGGGIFGACAARDAAQRGLSTALIDRGDFGGGVSANCFKIIHGGIRYLQHADVWRMRQSSRARRTFLRVAPHLSQPLPIIVPTFGRGAKGKLVLRTGMAVYDSITFDRNRGIHDPRRRIPRGRTLSRREVLHRFPWLGSEKRLTGAGVFSDGQIYSPPRLVLAYVQSAVESGAVAANYVEATSLIRESNSVKGVVVRDALSGESFEVRGRVVLNAAGPHAERLLADCVGQPLQPPTHWSRDACFVVKRRLLSGSEALALPGRTSDPDAKFSRGNRHLFLVPWRHYTLVGVWHKVHQGPPDETRVTEEELGQYIDEIHTAFPGARITLDDVSHCNSGLVAFGRNETSAKNLRYGHRSRLINHARVHGLKGLVTLIGIRFTTGPLEAVKAVNIAARQLRTRTGWSRSLNTPVYGGAIDDFEALVRAASRERPISTRAEVARTVVHNHGSEYRRVFRAARENAGWDATLHESSVMLAEVVHAIRHEMAQTLGDIVLRRTGLGSGEEPHEQALTACAELAAAELGWNGERTQSEIDAVLASYTIRRRSSNPPPRRQRVLI